MDLPGSPRAHVWVGLVIALVGVAIGGYAYTGDRAYHAVYILVAVLGFAMVVGGSMLTGWGQANRPRMGGKAARRKADKEGKVDKEDEGGSPGVTKRLAQAVTGLRERVSDRRRGETVVATLQCPDCGFVFEAEGEVPFEATCPECGYVDLVDEPPAGGPSRDGETEVKGSPRTRPAPEALEDEQTAGQAHSDGRSPGFAARLRERLPQRATGPAGSYTLACEGCGHVFTAEGQPPFEATCPDCGQVGTIEGAET